MWFPNEVFPSNQKSLLSFQNHATSPLLCYSSKKTQKTGIQSITSNTTNVLSWSGLQALSGDNAPARSSCLNWHFPPGWTPAGKCSHRSATSGEFYWATRFTLANQPLLLHSCTFSHLSYIVLNVFSTLWEPFWDSVIMFSSIKIFFQKGKSIVFSHALLSLFFLFVTLPDPLFYRFLSA